MTNANLKINQFLHGYYNYDILVYSSLPALANFSYFLLFLISLKNGCFNAYLAVILLSGK